ncbi:MAG: glycosyltransferase family 39 protein [Planctomycetaceae bacterium]
MKQSLSRQEVVLVLLAAALGLLLRCVATDRMAIEHFDEGVYASSAWYDDATGEPYPARHLYAPPLLPTMIRLAGWLPGGNSVGPFLPGLLLGTLTVLVVWYTGRSFFGLCGGLVAVFLAAMSDFHVLYSRMALTDVPVLCFICLSVVLGAGGIQQRSVRVMGLAGLACGLAWWTKYSGWLPLAIVGSGSVLWFVVTGRRQISIVTLLKLLLTMAAVAALCFAPWLWSLQDEGGYAAVAQNHRAYLNTDGFSGWRQRLASHVTYHFLTDSWLSVVSIGLGIVAAGSRRWMQLRSFTWNRAAEGNGPHQLVGDYPSVTLLAKFCAAAIVMTIVAMAIGSLGLLTCTAAGGLSGMFLARVPSDLHRRRTEQDLSPAEATSRPCTEADLNAAAFVDPLLGASIVIAWFAGMLLSTPMYHPFPRLSLPLLASVWLGAAGGLAWWIEANLNVARRGPRHSDESSRQSTMRQTVTVLVAAAVVFSLYSAGGFRRTPEVWADRTSLQVASWQIARAALDDAGEGASGPALLPSDTIIRPDSVPEVSAAEPGVTVKVDRSNPLADLQSPECLIYAFGEPAVLYHLWQAGIVARPVQDVTFPTARLHGEPLPTFLVIGPNALRTPGFRNDWAVHQDRFEHVTDIHFRPSLVVLLNLFTVDWLMQHFESQEQRLELYRLRPTHSEE